MSDIILESIRSLILAGIILYLVNAGRGRAVLSLAGWRFIIAGFCLLLFGSVIDITDNFESLNQFVVVGDTPIQATLEKLVGYLGGFLVLAIGLVRWIPTITALEQVESLAKFPSENPNPVCRISKDGTLLYSNNACNPFVDELGCAVGQRVPESVHSFITEAFRSKDTRVFDVERKNGQVVSFVVAPILGSDYANLYGLDVTKERKIEQMKSDFVSMASHQLKTPSAQIKGFIDNMLDGLTGPLNEKQKEYLHDMFGIADRNSKLIDDLLDVSRLERGICVADIRTAQIKEIVELAISPLRKMVHETGITITEHYHQESLYVLADFSKSVEALRNIMHNAIQLTKPSGSVTISMYKEHTHVVVSVKDEGEGLTPENQETLFTRAMILGGRVKASGAGLGLYLAKQFVELQGGTINVQTELGKGTTFYIVFQQPSGETRE